MTTGPIQVAPTVARPSDGQHEAIQHLLSGLPARPLLLVYGKHRTTEASWLCAYARAAGLDVKLAAAARKELSIQRRLGEETAAQVQPTAFVLADMTLSLPSGAVQLASLPDVSPLDLWQPRQVINEQARAVAAALPRELTISGAGGRLEVTVGPDGWTADAGTRGDGTVQVFPAGAAEAGVADASGTFVADGAIAVNRPLATGARLAARPVTVAVRDGAVVSVACPDPELGLFLRRAVEVHRVRRVAAIRIGVNRLTRDFGPDQGPVNACHHAGVTLRLGTDPGQAYSLASADLRIELTGSWESERS